MNSDAGGTPSPRAPRLAGFWIRTAAALLDVVVFVLVATSFHAIGRRLWGAQIEDSGAFQALVLVFTIVFTCLYTTVLHAVGGQTLGKLLMRVRVVDVDDGPLDAGAALLRYAGYYASLLTLGLGFLMAGLRRDKRALHDLIAGSRVERLPRQHRVGPVTRPADPVVPAGSA